MLIMSLSAKADNKQLERGEGMFTFQDPENKDLKPVDVHYYIPEDGNITTCPIIFVFQGNDRDYTYLMDTWGKDAKALYGFHSPIQHERLSATSIPRGRCNGQKTHRPYT